MNRQHKPLHIASFLLIFTLVIGLITPVTAKAETADGAWPTPPEILAGSAILMDADTGAILYEKDSHARSYPASTTKLMTGLLAVENTSLSDVITFSYAAAHSYKWDEANIATKEGEQFTMEQALYAMLLPSANEVAFGIAEYVGGSVPQFTNMMNERAKKLGALNTHFNNASGLSDTNHYTTAYDMAMIARACMNNATLMAIDSYSDYYKLGPTNKTTTVRNLYQRHEMLKNRAHYYEYCEGGKTGFTDESGYTLVTFAAKDNMRLVCVLFRENSSEDRYVDTKALLDYGFNNFKKLSVSSSDISSLFNSSNYYSSNVFGGSDIHFSMDASSVDLPGNATMNDVTLIVNNTMSNTNGTNTAASSSDTFTAGIQFDYQGNTVGTANLVVSTPAGKAASTGLPYLNTVSSTELSPKKCLVIDYRYIIILVIAILIFCEILDNVRERNRRLRNRRRRRRGQLPRR